MTHYYYEGFHCPECDHLNLSLCTYIGEEQYPVVMYDSSACSELKCESCGKSWYTGDFDLLGEDEI